MTDFAVDLYFNPADHAALLRVVDPDGTRNGQGGITLHADESIEPTFVRIVTDSPDFPADLLVVQKVMDFDPLSGALITLGHNVAGDLEATKPWARTNDDGVNLLDTEEGRAAWDALVGIEREHLYRIAIQHADHVALQGLVDRMTEQVEYDVDDADPDTTLDGRDLDSLPTTDEHHHPNTLDEHGGEG